MWDCGGLGVGEPRCENVGDWECGGLGGWGVGWGVGDALEMQLHRP